jgi:hypothetical protein
VVAEVQGSVPLITTQATGHEPETVPSLIQGRTVRKKVNPKIGTKLC